MKDLLQGTVFSCYFSLVFFVVSLCFLKIITEVSCGSLNTIEFSTNTTTQGDDLYLDQITVSCISGYQQNGGDLVRNCTSAGTWNGIAPTCASEFIVKRSAILTISLVFHFNNERP